MVEVAVPAGGTARELNALVVRGGWDGHQPVRCTEEFLDHLRGNGFTVTVTERLETYADPDAMRDVDLILQCFTGGQLTAEQERGLVDAVAGGAGFAGWHGGVVATFAAAERYQYMVGGRFVCHPGGFVDHAITVHPGHSIVDGVDDYAVHTEQYFCHVDPTLTVLATTTFTGAHGAPETAGAVMPVVWLRRYGRGRVFVCTLGHAPDDLRVPQTRTIIERGLLWAGLPEANVSQAGDSMSARSAAR